MSIAKIRKLAAGLGHTVQIVKYPTNYAYQYDPESKEFRASTKSNIIHEIAHYLVCPPEFRNMHNFGLGFGPDFGSFGDYRSLKGGFKVENQEEALASILGICIEDTFGMSSAKTWEDHCWGFSEDFTMSCNEEDWWIRDSYDRMCKLESMGLIARVDGKFRACLAG